MNNNAEYVIQSVAFSGLCEFWLERILADLCSEYGRPMPKEQQ